MPCCRPLVSRRHAGSAARCRRSPRTLTGCRRAADERANSRGRRARGRLMVPAAEVSPRLASSRTAGRATDSIRQGGCALAEGLRAPGGIESSRSRPAEQGPIRDAAQVAEEVDEAHQPVTHRDHDVHRHADLQAVLDVLQRAPQSLDRRGALLRIALDHVLDLDEQDQSVDGAARLHLAQELRKLAHSRCLRHAPFAALPP